ncbi:MAG: hypothetical protein MMC23_000335 [Stictis urceolatum]|nr:hypothetical protein [Stictis urceolata]
MAQTQDNSDADPSAVTMKGQTASILFELPPELRLQVYEKLLVNKGTTWGHPGLHPHILATCRRIYNEARHLLTHKNTFGILVASTAPMYGETCIDLLGEEDALNPSGRWKQSSDVDKRLRDIQSFEIKITLQIDAFESTTIVPTPSMIQEFDKAAEDSDIRLTAYLAPLICFLNRQPILKYLGISFEFVDVKWGVDARVTNCLGLLRGIEKVTIEADFNICTDERKDTLIHQMQGNSPVERHLPLMYAEFCEKVQAHAKVNGGRCWCTRAMDHSLSDCPYATCSVWWETGFGLDGFEEERRHFERIMELEVDILSRDHRLPARGRSPGSYKVRLKVMASEFQIEI